MTAQDAPCTKYDPWQVPDNIIRGESTKYSPYQEGAKCPSTTFPSRYLVREGYLAISNWQVAPSKAGLLSACDSGQGEIRTYHLELEVSLDG
jgi:hypothetical protein